MNSPRASGEPVTPSPTDFGNPLLQEPILDEDRESLTMNKRVDLVGSLAISVVGAIVLILAFSYPTPRVVFDSIGPMGVPKVIGAFLVIGGLVQSINTWRYVRRHGWWAVEEGTEDEPEHPSSRWRALVMMAASFVYLALLNPIGFEIMTPLAIALALGALGYRNWLWRAIVGVGFTVFSFVVFGIVLGVPLPHGVLEGPLFALGLVSF